MFNFSFKKEQKRKNRVKTGDKDQILDQVRKVLASTEQGLIFMAK